MFIATKDFQFSASHRLLGLADGHPCGRLHGHTYTVRVQVTGTELDDTGQLVDWETFDMFDNYVREFVDHRHLNGVIENNPTAEHVAAYLLSVAQAACVDDGLTISVGVSQSPQTWAWVSSE